jgi:predicted nucleic acid-binding protein
MRIYLDTNVIMDLLLGRDSAAYQLVIKICSEQHEVIISSLVVAELERNGLSAEGFIALLCSNTIVITCSPDEHDRMEARQLPTHFADALHYVLACRYGADYLVTKNIKDFPFDNIRRPDEL